MEKADKMEKIIVLNIVFSASPKEKHLDMYVYDENNFIEKVDESCGIEYLKTKSTVKEEYTWHFSSNKKLQEFIDEELAGYYGKMKLQTLSGYLVRSLNYRHTGISLRSFTKGMIYIGIDNKEYICLAGATIYDSKWLHTETLSIYRSDPYKKGSFLIPKETVFDVMDWLQVETEIVNITARAEIQDYIIEKNKVVFR